ncbi:hypothetical protein BpHYR1_036414 [Brachionus plicatilis]|uniref:Uncharacterized protein n=1 Tax=Brachionus plicatilis TaxID=10195 RepID=A0A3M7SIN4_BRAPC|nr:hypothetical protein BpHYR1_036414 [Brachionus plicatilis]
MYETRGNSYKLRREIKIWFVEIHLKLIIGYLFVSFLFAEHYADVFATFSQLFSVQIAVLVKSTELFALGHDQAIVVKEIGLINENFLIILNKISFYICICTLFES